MDSVEEAQPLAAPELSRRHFRAWSAVVLLFAAVVRIWGLDHLPPGLFCDEAANGYNAYSLLESGRDEEGKAWPLYIWSFGVSYKNPVFIYSAIPIVGALGLSAFSIRLTAALWGVAGVAAVLWLGTVLFGRRGGLSSAALLAILPWHVHFSRIAFELIAFLPFFAAANAAFLRAVRGDGRWLVAAAVLFSLSLYTYAPAKMFVPLFIAVLAWLYLPQAWARLRWVVAGAGAAILVGLPLALFDLRHRDRTGQYFSETTVLDASLTWLENLRNVAARWCTFFSPNFLFLDGDPLVRHSVPEVGQLYVAMAPLLLIGIVWALRRHQPQGKALLAWLVLFPLAPSLMNEVPSASRGFPGVAAFCLLAVAGGEALRRWTGGRGRAIASAGKIALGALAVLLAAEAGRYAYRYSVSYPGEAAVPFQFGYGPVVARMEPERDRYDRLMITTSEGNQAQIFPLFYNRYDPQRWLRSFDPGYLIIDPAEFKRYDPEKERVLAALRESDLNLFDKVEEVDRIYDPAGRVQFVIAEIAQRGFYLRDWLLLGAFDNRDGVAQRTLHVPGGRPSLDAYVDKDGERYWRRIVPDFVRIELHNFFREQIEPSGAEPIWACAYATTEIVAAAASEVVLHLEGRNQWVEGWLNGVPLHRRSEQIGGRRAQWHLRLQNGGSQLLIKSCRGDADWYFTARLRGKGGGRPVGIRARASIAAVPVEVAAAAPPAPVEQVANGFAEIDSFSHTFESDADYRGNSRGWVEHLYDADGAVSWWTAPLARQVTSAVAFGALLSPQAGRADLWVDGRHALTFDTGRFTTPRTWRGNGFVLHYEPKQISDYHSGVFVLEVPARHVRAGQPLRLRVSHVEGMHDASFMLKAHRDTVEHEGITLSSLAEKRL